MYGLFQPADESLPPGTLVGRHRVTARLAEGAHAIVYLGEHQVTGAEVAIKVLRRSHGDSSELRARFDREARVMGRVAGSTTIAQVHDAGQLHDGRRFLVMELVRGRELSTVLANAARRGVPLEFERVIAIAHDVAAALRDAHLRGVVHRDLKPSNVMIMRETDGREHAKLVDFGVSGDLGARGSADELTAAGAVIGTPAYMSPEQAMGLPASVSMDVFALGVLIFEMLTGTVPPQQALRQGSVPRVATLRSGVPAALDVLVHRCLLVDPRARLGDAIEALSCLRSAGEQLGVGTSANAWLGDRPLRAAGAIDVAAAHDDAPPRPPRPSTPRTPSPRPASSRTVARVLGVLAVVLFGLAVGLALWRFVLAPGADAARERALTAPMGPAPATGGERPRPRRFRGIGRPSPPSLCHPCDRLRRGPLHGRRPRMPACPAHPRGPFGGPRIPGISHAARLWR